MPETPQYTPIEVYLTVAGGLDAIAFYEKAFGAVEGMKMMAKDGKRLMHATLNVFGGQVMMSDHFAEYPTATKPPTVLGGTTFMIHVNLAKPADVDAAIARAVAAGATVAMPAEDTFWGMRYGQVRDPFGHVWAFGAMIPGVQPAMMPPG